MVSGSFFRRSLIALCLCVVASSCASPEKQAAYAAQLEATDHAECVRLGFAPASVTYGDCRLRLRELRQQERLANRPVTFDPYFGPRFGYVYR